MCFTTWDPWPVIQTILVCTEISSSNRANFAWLFLGQILLGYSFCTRGGGHWAYAPMTPPWYKTNNPAEFADLIFETPWYK